MRFFVVPIVWVVIVLPIGPVPALLAGILAFFLYPLWYSWRVERAAEKAENRRAVQWDAEQKAKYNEEDERRRLLGLPSQLESRDHLEMAKRFGRAHYQHLKSKTKHDNCLYCYKNKPDYDEFHFRIWQREEQEEADFSMLGMEHPGSVPGYIYILNTNKFDINKAAEKAINGAPSKEYILRIEEARDRILRSNIRF